MPARPVPSQRSVRAGCPRSGRRFDDTRDPLTQPGPASSRAKHTSDPPATHSFPPLATADTDHSGEIDYEEFKSLLSKKAT